jgi:hypothetical protein
MGDILKLLADAAEIANDATMSISADGQKAVARAKAESFGDDEDVRKLLAAVAEGLAAGSGGGATGTVTNVSVATANGFSGVVANPTTTPVITLTADATIARVARTPVTDATTARTLSIADMLAYITNTNAGAFTLTIPTNSAVAIPVGTHVIWRRAAGAGAVTLAFAGVTVNGNALVPTIAADGNFGLYKKAANEWDVI